MRDDLNPAALLNYEAEQALLGAIFANNLVYSKVSDFLLPIHFADALHGRIFAAAARRIRNGELCNALTLKAEFETDPALLDAGGAKYLARIAASVVTIIGAEDYGHAIRDLWMRRELIARADEMRAAAGDMGRPVDETAMEVVRDLTEMAADGSRGALDKETVASSLVESILRPGACYSTGIQTIDHAMGGGLYAGKLYGIAARKKVGKTVLLGTISHNLHKAKVPHLFIALEMSPAEIEQRNAARELGINSISFLRNPSRDLARRVADEYAVGLGGYAVYESAPGASLDAVRAMIARAVTRHKIRGVILDYWQLVGGKAPKESEEYHLRAVAQSLADTCRKQGLWALAAAQVNQEGNTRGGDGLKLACDLYFTLHREKGSDGAWLEMEESRYAPYCNVGSENAPGLWLNHHGPYFDDMPAPLSVSAGGGGNG